MTVVGLLIIGDFAMASWRPCMKNCAQCKKMYGPYFEGQVCAQACVDYNGQYTPDCFKMKSVAPFLNKLE